MAHPPRTPDAHSAQVSPGQASTVAQAPLETSRARLLERLAATQTVDLLVIGGGATGLGVALDAALRGLSVVLLDARDFAKGTSSRATKLVHGGVRYLAQGNVALVREALHERRKLLRNASHLAAPLAFVMPAYKCWEAPRLTMRWRGNRAWGRLSYCPGSTRSTRFRECGQKA